MGSFVKARLHWPNRNGLFAILMIISAVLMFVPSRYTGSVKTVRQILVPFQDGLHSLTSGSSKPATNKDTRATVPAEQYNKIVGDLEAARNELVSLQLQLREIESEQPTLGMYLRKFIDRSTIREGRLVPARVIAGEPTGLRDSFLLGGGRRRGIKIESWVASRRMIDAGTKDGVQTGMSVLAREYLIGKIEDVTPFSSRVALLSDVDAQAETWIGRVMATRFNVLSSPDAVRSGQVWAQPGQEAVFFLTGRGKGDMLVKGVHEDYIRLNALQVGDLVVSPGTGPDLPVAMLIGRVEKIEDDPSQRQLRQLIVRCPIDLRSLRWVYVLDVAPVDRG